MKKNQEFVNTAANGGQQQASIFMAKIFFKTLTFLIVCILKRSHIFACNLNKSNEKITPHPRIPIHLHP